MAHGAVVAGDVTLGAGASVWFQAVIRGDTEAIRIGARSNVQDGVVIHADPGFPCVIGDGVTIGHRAVVHGATVGDGALIGIGAIVLNGATVGARSLVGAGALLVGGRAYPPEHLIVGAPAVARRPLTQAEIDDLARSAEHYVAMAGRWRTAGWADGFPVSP